MPDLTLIWNDTFHSYIFYKRNMYNQEWNKRQVPNVTQHMLSIKQYIYTPTALCDSKLASAENN